MAQLKNSQEKILLSDLQVAKNLWSRTRGLLGTSDLGPQSGLWIHRCNSIHTFFMRYAIDCVFVDADLKVKAVVENVRPGRLVWPIWGASSVIEMKAGRIRDLGIQAGDKLHVGT